MGELDARYKMDFCLLGSMVVLSDDGVVQLQRWTSEWAYVIIRKIRPLERGNTLVGELDARYKMDFCLLGSMVVLSDDGVVQLQRGKLRIVLATLLLNANMLVTVDSLIDALWDVAPPPSAQVTVRNYIKRLRSALGSEGRSRISTEPNGYVIRVNSGELDIDRFNGLLRFAQASAREERWDAAASQARGALRLWRGDPLIDVESPTLAQRETPRLEEMHLQALETRIQAELQLGRHAEVIVELQQLVSIHPLREQLQALLMRALYLYGQQAEAITVYERVRRTLVDELGIEPGKELRGLHLQMLRQELNDPRARASNANLSLSAKDCEG